MKKLRVSDEVVVLAGKEKGKSGKVKSINWKTNRVFVEGLNVMKKAVRPSQEDPNGGIKDVEMSLHISNISVVSPKNNKPTRVRIEKVEGKNKRVAVACGTVLDK